MQTSSALRAAAAALAFLFALMAHGGAHARVLADEASFRAADANDDAEALRSDLSLTPPIAPAPHRRLAARELKSDAPAAVPAAPADHHPERRVRWRRLPRMSLEPSSDH